MGVSVSRRPMTADIVIRGGTVVDGTGAPGRTRRRRHHRRRHHRDRRRASTGERELDASGHMVTPGFVDIHTHYDAQVFWDPALVADLLARRDVGRRRQLRLLDRARAARAPRAARPHAPARRGHGARHALRGRAVGRLRDVPAVPRRDRGARHAAQLRVLRRAHRGAHLRHGRSGLRAGRDRRRDRAACSR